MELPVLYAFTWPERVADGGVPSYDPVATGPLTFEPVRSDAFPMLGLGIGAGRAGGAAPAVFNAANEEAVAAFLAGRLRFGDIGPCVASALDRLGGRSGDSLDALLDADAEARRFVRASLDRPSR
jgi:1-deoxy-D-xylulose-5-phosphate reductoisomerase